MKNSLGLFSFFAVIAMFWQYGYVVDETFADSNAHKITSERIAGSTRYSPPKCFVITFPIKSNGTTVTMEVGDDREFGISPSGNLLAKMDRMEKPNLETYTTLRIYDINATEISNFEIKVAGSVHGIRITDLGKVIVAGRMIYDDDDDHFIIPDKNDPYSVRFYSLEGQQLNSEFSEKIFFRWGGFTHSVDTLGYFYLWAIPYDREYLKYKKETEPKPSLFVFNDSFEVIVEMTTALTEEQLIGWFFGNFEVNIEHRTVSYEAKVWSKNGEKQGFRVYYFLRDWAGNLIKTDERWEE